MKTQEAVTRAVDWINQAERQAFQVEGSYANGGRAAHLLWMKNSLVTAPSEEAQSNFLTHLVGTGTLPQELLRGE